MAINHSDVCCSDGVVEKLARCDVLANWFRKLRFALISMAAAFTVRCAFPPALKKNQREANSLKLMISSAACPTDNAAHPLYLNISFRIDFENCSSWLSDYVVSPHIHNSHSNHQNDSEEEKKIDLVFSLTSTWLDRDYCHSHSIVNNKIILEK